MQEDGKSSQDGPSIAQDSSSTEESTVLITALACHPRIPLVVAGFADGTVRMLWFTHSEKTFEAVRWLLCCAGRRCAVFCCAVPGTAAVIAVVESM
jgi:hypothetical protein